MLKTSYKYFVLVAIYLGFISCIHAGGMKVEPGLWETKSLVTSPSGTHENVSQDCIKESEITPESMMDDNNGCEVIDLESGANSMQWSIRCENEGVAMTGEGNAESSGSSISGGMNIKANFNGQEFTMATKWEGARIGDCK